MYENYFVSVIVAAAGMSNRMGSKINKQFIAIDNKPILVHTLEKFEETRNSLTDDLFHHLKTKKTKQTFSEKEIMIKLILCLSILVLTAQGAMQNQIG